MSDCLEILGVLIADAVRSGGREDELELKEEGKEVTTFEIESEPQC